MAWNGQLELGSNTERLVNPIRIASFVSPSLSEGIAPLVNLHCLRDMIKPRQLNLLKKDLRFHGGSLLYKRRKSRRPLSTKEAIHIVLRSTWAYGTNSFLLLKNKKDIERIILRVSQKYLIRVYRQAIVTNHLHLIIKISSRKNYQTFIRVLSSAIASHVMGMQSYSEFRAVLAKQSRNYKPPARLGRGDPPDDPPKVNYDALYWKALNEIQGIEQAFWQFRPFTRVLCWGKDFKQACNYLLQNTLEALGFIFYVCRKDYYNKHQFRERNKCKGKIQHGHLLKYQIRQNKSPKERK